MDIYVYQMPPLINPFDRGSTAHVGELTMSKIAYGNTWSLLSSP